MQLKAVSLPSHCQGEVTSVSVGGIFWCSVLQGKLWRDMIAVMKQQNLTNFPFTLTSRLYNCVVTQLRVL